MGTVSGSSDSNGSWWQEWISSSTGLTTQGRHYVPLVGVAIDVQARGTASTVTVSQRYKWSAADLLAATLEPAFAGCSAAAAPLWLHALTRLREPEGHPPASAIRAASTPELTHPTVRRSSRGAGAT